MTAISRAGARGFGLASVGALFQHQLRRTRRSWIAALAAGLATPTLFLLAIGGGLGSQIDDAELTRLGVDSYMDYVGPGVLIVTAMQIAATEGMWPTMGLLRWEGVYKAILATPISSRELGVSHVLWIGFRGMVTATCFFIVLSIAGVISSWWGICVIGVALLVAWAHAAPMVALTVGLKQENLFPMISRVIIFPLFLFSGAFFPVDDMPRGIAAFAKITPSWHGVEAARHFASGQLSDADAMHVGYVSVLALLGFLAVRRQFPRHLEI